MPNYRIDKPTYFKKVGYHPFPEQLDFHRSTARFRVPACGRRFGKSTMVAHDRAPSLLLPNTRGWIVGPSYALAEKEFRVMWDGLIVKLGLGKNKLVKRNYNLRSGEMWIKLPWNSEVVCKSAQNDDQLVGEDLDWVIFSEAAKHAPETWQRYIRPALMDSHGEADFPSTPEGFNWYYGLWREHLTSDDYAAWRNPSWLNSVLFPGGRQDPEILLLERTTIAEWFQQEIAADFTAFVGKIFGEFDETVHVTDVPYNPSLPNYVAFDWGYTNPLAAVEFQVEQTPQGERIRVWREHYKSYETLSWHLATLKQREQPEGYKIDLCFGDPADPGSIETVSREFAPCIGDPKMKENWMAGVNTIKQFLRLEDTGAYDEHERPVKAPMYVVDRSCVEHIREMSDYRAKDHVTTEMRANSVVARVDDHTIDAIRYALVYLFEVGKHHLSDVYSQVTAPNTGRETHFQYNEPAMTTGMRF